MAGLSAMDFPRHYQTKFTNLPETAESGGIYFVTDDQGVPVGIALSGPNKQVQFFGCIPAVNAGADPITFFENWVNLKGYYKLTSKSGSAVKTELYKTADNTLVAALTREQLADGRVRDTFVYGGETTVRVTSLQGSTVREEMS